MTIVTQSAQGVRGQPLFVLVALLGGWIAARAVLWQSPFPVLTKGDSLAVAPPSQAVLKQARAPSLISSPVPQTRKAARNWLVPAPLDSHKINLPSGWRTMEAVEAQAVPTKTGTDEPQIVSQQLLLAAAFAHMEMPLQIASYFTGKKDGSGTTAPPPPAPPANPAPIRPASAQRWSADGWLLTRRDSARALAAGEPSYGRSQVGAVLRYRLAPASGHRPAVYTRVTRTLAGPRETEVAAGLSARPVAGLPVSVAGEIRANEGAGRREIRPAAFAVAELPPTQLPLGLRGEAYAQAGYVGGRFATAFIDGQARVDAHVLTLGKASEVRAGAGVWGGAQKHTARLDVGPSATIGLPIGAIRSRLAIDYRWRVAGNAQPESGPALTISAGF